jgi:glutamine synthetase
LTGALDGGAGVSGGVAVPAALRDAARDRRVQACLAESGIESVHLGLFDSSGTLREKRLSPPAAARALEEGWSFIDAIDWWDPADGLRRAGGSSHQPAEVDTESARPYPFEPASTLWLADFVGELEAVSPRRQLEGMVERAASMGLVALVGWETECIVLEPTQRSPDAMIARPTPWLAANRCWSARTPAAEAETWRELTSLLEAAAVPVDHMCSELGPGCLELAVAPRGAVRSADDAALLKVFTKAFFDRRGLVATFMAQLGDDFPGLGCHPSVSFHLADGTSALVDPDGTLTATGGAAIAGVVRLLPELFALIAPYPNSYRRFAPGNWAPSAATWGVGNYSCALRAVCQPVDRARLELRAPGADVSPHLCLAMFLGAAMWGIERGLEAPPALAPPLDGRLAEGVERFPRSLAEAADRLGASAAAAELFGPAFVAHHVGACAAEDAACRRMVPAGERERYLWEA